MRSVVLAALLFSTVPHPVLADEKSDQLQKDKPLPLTAPFDEEQAKGAQQAWAKALGKSSPVEKNSIGMELVLIPPGKFRMGSPLDEKDRGRFEGQVDVTLTRSFFLGKTEVTQAQWRAVMGTTPWKGSEHRQEGDAYPAGPVSWDDSQAFCEKLSEKEKRRYRLPTEAEWEYACRAGTTTRFSFGEDKSLLRDYAWFGAPIGEGVDHKACQHEVGLKKPNPFGLFDMHGNVGEWCADWLDSDNSTKSPLVDPAGPPTGSYRVYRGGGWFSATQYCRSASRGWGDQTARQFLDQGFRVACSAVQSSGYERPETK
jgi:formylglycine-generating enzyme required for sulfatase activity